MHINFVSVSVCVHACMYTHIHTVMCAYTWDHTKKAKSV